MAIRDKFRRAVGTSSRKSTTSSSSSSSTHVTETTSTADSESSSSSSSPVADRKSRARTFTWRSAKSADDKEQQQKKNKKKTFSDPREKPFTEMNLRYQEILGSYELTFGTSHPEQLWNPDGELSPGTSRQNSIDLGRN